MPDSKSGKRRKDRSRTNWAQEEMPTLELPQNDEGMDWLAGNFTTTRDTPDLQAGTSQSTYREPAGVLASAGSSLWDSRSPTSISHLSVPNTLSAAAMRSPNKRRRGSGGSQAMSQQVPPTPGISNRFGGLGMRSPAPGCRTVAGLQGPSPNKKRRITTGPAMRPRESHEPPANTKEGDIIYIPDPLLHIDGDSGSQLEEKTCACEESYWMCPTANPRLAQAAVEEVTSAPWHGKRQRAYRVRVVEAGHPYAEDELFKVLASDCRTVNRQPPVNGAIDIPSVGVIIEFLTFQEIMKVSRTCVYWYRNAFKHLKRVTPIAKHFGGIWADELKVFLSRMSPALKGLDLRFVCQAVNDSVLEIIGNRCKGLVEFNLYNCENITNNGFMAMARNIRQLVRLDISGCSKLENSGLDVICRSCPKLETLSIAYLPDLSSRTQTMRAVKRLAHLKNLNLHEAGGPQMSYYEKFREVYREPRPKKLNLIGGLNESYPTEMREKQKEDLKSVNIHYNASETESISENRWQLKLARLNEAKQFYEAHAFQVPQSKKVYAVVWTEHGTFAVKLKLEVIRRMEETLVYNGKIRSERFNTADEFMEWYNGNLADPLVYLRDTLDIGSWQWLESFQNLVTLDMVGFDKCDWISMGLKDYGGDEYRDGSDSEMSSIKTT